MTADETILNFAIFISENFWSGRLPTPEDDPFTIATLLSQLGPKQIEPDVLNRTCFLLAEALQILRAYKKSIWVN